MTTTIAIISLGSTAILLLATGYLLGRWHGAELAERAAVGDAINGPSVGTKGGGGKPPVKR